MSYGNNLAEGSTGKGLESNSPSNSTVYCSCWGHSYPQTQQQQRTIAAGLYMCVKCCSYVQDSSSTEKCMENVWRMYGESLALCSRYGYWILLVVILDRPLALQTEPQQCRMQNKALSIQGLLFGEVLSSLAVNLDRKPSSLKKHP